MVKDDRKTVVIQYTHYNHVELKSILEQTNLCGFTHIWLKAGFCGNLRLH